MRNELAVSLVMGMVLSGCTAPSSPDRASEDASGSPDGSAPAAGQESMSATNDKIPDKADLAPFEAKQNTTSKIDILWTDGRVGGRLAVCLRECASVPLSEDRSSRKEEFKGTLLNGSLELAWSATTPLNNQMALSVRACKNDCQSQSQPHFRHVSGYSPLPLLFSYDEWPKDHYVLHSVSPALDVSESLAISGGGAGVVTEQSFEVKGHLWIEKEA